MPRFRRFLAAPWKRFLYAPLPMVALSLMLAEAVTVPAASSDKVFRAGACVLDITPEQFPVLVNGMMEQRTAQSAQDRLHARCLVLDDGKERVALVVVDSCMMPRELLDEAKELVSPGVGLAADHILISATHTHSAPAVMGCLGCDADARYPAFLKAQLARVITNAVRTLQPARVGWTSVAAPQYTHNRRWILRSDRIRPDPFGKNTVRAQMHPGYRNADFIGPSGPVDPELSLLALQSKDGRPIAVLANYSMHYFGSVPLSADYFGAFTNKLARSIGTERTDPPFVAIMSQGTSGDLMWMDYSNLKSAATLDQYAGDLARLAKNAYSDIEYHDGIPLVMRERKLRLSRRTPGSERLKWAKSVIADLKDRKPRTYQEIYAREQIFLYEQPRRELKLQALRIGDLGIAAIPDEVFAITGLKIKAFSPLRPTFTIELANGSEGYIPPPEQHQLGGYTTWAARTAGLEVHAEPKILETVLQLLEEVSGKPRRPFQSHDGPYAHKVLASKPSAYWRLEELNGLRAVDTTGRHHGHYEEGVALFLDGPASRGLSGGKQVNRCVHFAGGRMKAELEELRDNYSVELWFWNGLPTDLRPVTGYLFSHSRKSGDEAFGIGGSPLGSGGRARTPPVLFLSIGDSPVLRGKTKIALKTWNHLVFTREGKKVSVYLNGKEDMASETAVRLDPGESRFYFGGGAANRAGLEGKLDEIAVYPRVLTATEIAEHYAAAQDAR
jgi:hypothetical protein